MPPWNKALWLFLLWSWERSESFRSQFADGRRVVDIDVELLSLSRDNASDVQNETESGVINVPPAAKLFPPIGSYSNSSFVAIADVTATQLSDASQITNSGPPVLSGAFHPFSKHRPHTHEGGFRLHYILGSLIKPAGYALCLFLVLALMWLGKRSRNSDEADDGPAPQVIRRIALMTWFQLLVFSAAIPDSYDLTIRMGGTAWQSGALVGICTVGVGIADIVLWYLNTKDPEFWRSSESIVKLAGLGQLVASSLYLCVTVAVDLDLSSSYLLGAACFVRVLQGCAAGVVDNTYRNLILRLLRNEERPAAFLVLFAVQILALGGGPLLAAFAHQFNTGPKSFASIAAIQALVMTPLGLLCLVKFPSMKELQDQHSSENTPSAGDLDASSASKKHVPLASKAIICINLCFSIVRAGMFTGLEVSTAMMLETSYHWRVKVAGAAIGLTFLGVAPLKFIYDKWSDRLLKETWVRIFFQVALLGAVFLFESPRRSGLDGQMDEWMSGSSFKAGSLIFADFLIYPCIALGAGLQTGITMNHCVAGTFWSGTNYILASCVLLNVFARQIGSIFSRHLVHIGGRNSYAMQQLLILVFLLFLSEIIRYLAASPATDDKASSPKEPRPVIAENEKNEERPVAETNSTNSGSVDSDAPVSSSTPDSGVDQGNAPDTDCATDQ